MSNSDTTVTRVLRPDQYYRLRDILVIAVLLDHGWWQMTDVAWREKDGGEPWIW